MVFYFTSNVVNPPAIIYMGLDKYENESLIRFGFPEDIWFHVEKLSSAHVYLRLPKGKSINDIEPALLEDCAQLVKSNSIMGSKKNNIDVIYTKWSNLRKGADMEVGQIGFYNEKEVKKIRVEKKDNAILNRLNKTKVEKFPSLEAEREERDRLERSENKMQIRAIKEKEKEDAAKREEEKLLKSYASLMISEKMQSNQDDGEDSDDFM